MDTNMRLARLWLRGQGLDEATATPALAARLAVRRWARLIGSVLLASTFIGGALVQTWQLFAGRSGVALGGLAAFMAGVIGAQFWLDRRVRAVDQRVGTTLSRRATHPVHPGWRAVIGPPHALVGVCSFVGSAALAVAALAVADAQVRYAGLVLLTCVCGVGAVAALQLRHLLTRPVVADDEASLTADVIMRVEDARDASVPSVLWSLPVVLLFGTAPAWWGATAVGFLIVQLIALVVVHMRTPRSLATARRVVHAR